MTSKPSRSKHLYYCLHREEVVGHVNRQISPARECSAFKLDSHYMLALAIAADGLRVKAPLDVRLKLARSCLYCSNSQPVPISIKAAIMESIRESSPEGELSVRPQPQPITASRSELYPSSGAVPEPQLDHGPALVKNRQNEHSHTQKA